MKSFSSIVLLVSAVLSVPVAFNGKDAAAVVSGAALLTSIPALAVGSIAYGKADQENQRSIQAANYVNRLSMPPGYNGIPVVGAPVQPVPALTGPVVAPLNF